FEPLFLKPDPASYLSQLRSISDGIVTQEETWIGQMPDFDTVRSPARGIDAGHLRTVLQAIHSRRAIEIEYQSLSSPTPRWRWIAPHAIAFDGFRWHARAYCFTDGCFKDFLLARILGTRDSRPSDIDDSQDADWHTHVTLKIGPHPGLSDAQKKVVGSTTACGEARPASPSARRCSTTRSNVSGWTLTRRAASGMDRL